MTEHVVASMRAIAERGSHEGDVFMKAGASGTVSTQFLYCFAGAAGTHVDLAGRDELAATVEHFLAGDAAGTTPFDRDTLAAEVGRTASWVIAGDPSPLDQEIAAIDPWIAFVNYGTNDMGQGATYASAASAFHDSFNELLDRLEAQGIVPIVTGLNPRDDSAAAARWVPTYNAIVRGVAEARQIPWIHLYRAVVHLPDMGLVSDGIHGNVFFDGVAEPCDFTAPALQFNYNVRNLLSLEALDVVRHTVLIGEAAPDDAVDGFEGDGSSAAPFVVDRLPFTHAGDTSASTTADLESYPSCDDGQDESGPEVVYRIELRADTALRIVALDRGDVDVDVHLLDALDSAACLERGDRLIERTLVAGTYWIVVDTFVSDGDAAAGRYQLVVVACEPGDPDC